VIHRLRRSAASSLAALVVLIGPASPASGQAPSKAAAPPTSPAATRPAPKPAAVASLEVTVADSAGKPVEGALVLVLPATGAHGPGGRVVPGKARSGFTSAEGKVALEALPPGPWNAWVHARGFVTRPLRGVAAGPLRVRLERGEAITGVVRDGDDGHPVPGARVGFDAGLPAAGWPAEAVRNEALTDASGRFRLGGVGRGAVRLSVLAPGYARADRGDVRAGAAVEIVLFPGATLSGSVRDGAGRPVRGAVVRAESDTAWNAPPPERTDARGGFAMPGVPPGEYTVVAREGGRAPAIAVVVVEPRGEVAASLTLSDGGYVTGRIVDDEERPLAGRVRVEAYEGKALPAFAADLLAAEAGTDGTFALGPVPPGPLAISVSAPRHSAARVEADVPGPGRAVDLGDVALDPGLAIRGRVRDPEEQPVAGATVRATAQSPGGSGEAEAESGPDGRFELGGLGPGRYGVHASAAGYASGEATADAGGEPVEVVLDLGGILSGRVVDAGGEPVEGAEVSARDESQPGGWRVFSGRSDEGDGRFSLRDVSPGRYDLEVRAGARGEASRAGVRVPAGRTTDLGTVVLARGGVVRGEVVDAEGRGIAGATVSAEREATIRTGRRETQTGSSGAFELRGLPAGAWFLAARHPSYAASAPLGVQVEPEDTAPPARIVLARGGRIEGRALHRDGRPFAGGRVHARALDERAPGDWGAAALDTRGVFVLDRVPSGRVSVELMAFTPASPMAFGPAGMTVLSSVDSRELVVRDGETSTLDFVLRDVVVSGRVTRGGQGEGGVLVGVIGRRGGSVYAFMGARPASAVPSGPPPLAAVTGEDGGYELLVFAPGPAAVLMHSGIQSHPGRDVEIPDVERFTLDLEIAPATVEGVVVDRDSGEPVSHAAVSLRPAEPSPPRSWGAGSAQTGPDGRFSIATDPGEYHLVAQAKDRQPVTIPLSVGPSGVADLLVELERGLAISGRLVDAAGRPAPGLPVRAAAEDGVGGGSDSSASDGGFRLGGLRGQPHVVAGGSELAGFGVRAGVAPGAEPILLPLRPAARITVRVVDPAGHPVAGAHVRVGGIDGARVSLPGASFRVTDAGGRCELVSPAGRVEVEADHEGRSGRTVATAEPGARLSLTIALATTR
jgi:protocatechuate 3,4-dioxygenase beta subunit